MLTERKEWNRNVYEMTSPDLMVPQNHLLRKIDAAVDFDYIYTLVRDLYCADNGRPSVDPVVLFKLVLLQHLYGIPSLRRTVAEADMNVAYRWFLGYGLMERIPHFATISYAFRNRFDTETVEAIFAWILNEIEKAGYLSPEVVYVDGTHVKANANLKKQIKTGETIGYAYDLPFFLSKSLDLKTLLNFEEKGLFADNMKTGFQSCLGSFKMQEVRCCDVYCLDTIRTLCFFLKHGLVIRIQTIRIHAEIFAKLFAALKINVKCSCCQYERCVVAHSAKTMLVTYAACRTAADNTPTERSSLNDFLSDIHAIPPYKMV